MNTDQKTKSPPTAAAFYHEKGFVPAYNQATRFAEEHSKGRIATLPDVIDARLASGSKDSPWSTYFTTMTAEYLGKSRGGNKIIIVAHGVGPMATLDGVLAAYSHEFKDKDRNRRGGRISQEQFWNLESGICGPVAIVDFEAYLKRYRYPFSEQLRVSQALTDPLLKARLGPRAEEYLKHHAEVARKWHLQEAGIDPENRFHNPNHGMYLDRRRKMHLEMSQPDSDPFIVQNADASNCSYEHRKLEDGMAIAHLISIGVLIHTNHSDERMSHESLTFDVGCHEWWNGVRLIGIRSNEPITGINNDTADLRALKEKNWQTLMRPTFPPDTAKDGFFALMDFAGKTFTQYPKQGERMDTHEPEFLVTKVKKMKGPNVFTTTIGGYYGWFKYGIKEVQQIAPKGANAYRLVGKIDFENIQGNPTHHSVAIKFFHVEVDQSQRLIRDEQLRENYPLLMSLTGIQA